jgi:hypothetical protein
MMKDQNFANVCIFHDPWDLKQSPEIGRRLRRILKAIQNAHRSGLARRRSHFVNLFLCSTEAKVLAAREANRHLKPCNRLSDQKLDELAHGLNPWRGSKEAVKVRFKVKSNGDARPILEFGPEHRALQYLVVPVLRATAALNPSQFGATGGVHAAVIKAASGMAEGFRWGFHIDIKNCFPSFQSEPLTNFLALPKEVTERVILTRHFKLVSSDLEDLVGSADDGFHEPWLASVRSGISQGSAASNWVCEIVVGHVLRALPAIDGVLIVNYADNILILAKSEGEAVSMQLALGDALRVSPAGPLQPTIVQEFAPKDKCHFLGHSIWMEGKSVRIDVDESNLQKFHTRVKLLVTRVHGAPGPILQKRELRKAFRFLDSWSGAFKLTASAPALRAQWTKTLSQTATAVVL